ncbi:hypothetical protein [Clostridium fungisolvens]|uniref:Uncharacterized protein n=1 Tax=Clostridium fungisolvens TaxID=1604897 RepID=A0A6V8SHG2_9CLOT|nr:hypothetical protein [Clostridium fungisolvens]GFP76649.1 hypothetical protein bsdtw1_02752 [Clostridium fungisolvens]
MKKVISALLLSAMVLTFGGATFAKANGGSIDGSFNTYGGKGYLDGSAQAKYYHLTPGNVTANLTSYSGTGNMYLYLYEQTSGSGLNYYGVNTVNSTGAYRYKVGLDSYHYFLYATGSNNYTTYSFSGTMYDYYY